MYFPVAFIFISIVIFSSATPLPTPTPSTECFYQGSYYPPGEITSDPNGCSGVVCDPSGYAYYWDYLDTFYCGTSSPPVPTTAPTIAPTTVPQRCVYNGQYYHPGVIEIGNNGQGWCYGTICTNDYQVISWDNFNCGSTTTAGPPSTFPPPSSPPPTTIPPY